MASNDHVTFLDSIITTANRVVAAWLNDLNNYVWRGSRPTFGTTTGAANVYVLTLPATSLYTAAAEGDSFSFKAHQTNTGAATFSVVGGATLTPAALQVNGAALSGNEIVVGGAYQVTRVGAVWQVQGQLKLPVPISLGGTGQVAKQAAFDALSPTVTAGDVIINNGANNVAVPAAFSYKNLLKNPDGGIWTRAAAATADDTYFADCWYILSQTGTVTPSALAAPEDGFPKGVRITQAQAGAQRFGFAQIIEGKDCKHLRGSSGVLVPRIRCSSAQAIRYAILGWTSTEDSVTSDVVNDWTSAVYTAGNFFLGANLSVLVVGAQTPAANTWVSLAAITSAMGSTFTNVVLFVWTEGTAAQNVTLDYDYVQFEYGAVPTAFEHRPFGIEEKLCKRFLPYFNSSSTTAPISNGQALNVTTAHVTIPFDVEARIPPTGVTVSSAAHFALTIADGTTAVTSSLTFVNADTRAIKLSGDRTGSGLVAGNISMFSGASASGQLLFTGAEL